MRLILSQFLRTLRERDEFDRLLPDLLLVSAPVLIRAYSTVSTRFC